MVSAEPDGAWGTPPPRGYATPAPGYFVVARAFVFSGYVAWTVMSTVRVATTRRASRTSTRTRYLPAFAGVP